MRTREEPMEIIGIEQSCISKHKYITSTMLSFFFIYTNKRATVFLCMYCLGYTCFVLFLNNKL